MAYLRLLGGAFIETEDDHLVGPAGQRHRLGLLALLAVGAPHSISRDKLLAYLWPDRSEDRARNLLNQSVHQIRQAVNRQAIRSEGPDLRLDTDALPCDLCRFRVAMDEGRWAVAQGLYQGPFLDGFHLPDSAPFDRWMGAQQVVWASRYRECLEKLGDEAEVNGDWEAALHWWRLRWLEEPLNTGVAAKFVHTLALAGNAPQALVVAREHEALLREELGISPPESFRELIREVLQHRGGHEGREMWRLRTTVKPETPTGSPPAKLEEASPEGFGFRRPGSMGLVGASAVILGLLAVVGIGIPWMEGGPERELREAGGDYPTLVVLPFRNLGSPVDDPLAIHFTDALSRELMANPAVTVVGGARGPPSSGDEHLPQEALPTGPQAGYLGAGYILAGTIRVNRTVPGGGAAVRVAPSLIRALDGGRLWTAEYERGWDQQGQIRAEIVARVEHHLPRNPVATPD